MPVRWATHYPYFPRQLLKPGQHLCRWWLPVEVLEIGLCHVNEKAAGSSW